MQLLINLFFHVLYSHKLIFIFFGDRFILNAMDLIRLGARKRGDVSITEIVELQSVDGDGL